MKATTLEMVRGALKDETQLSIERQAGSVGWAMPLEMVLPQLDAQTLALVIRDMEDEANHFQKFDERDLWNVLTAARRAGEAQLGRTFDSVISEYE